MKNLLHMTNFHKLLFVSSIFPLIFFITIFELMNAFDSAFVLYSLSFFFSSVILIFWSYWYIKATQRSTIFLINGLLIFSMWYRTAHDMYSRAYFVMGNLEKYKEIITSDFWAYRVSIQILVLLWLLTWIVSRIFRGEEYFKDYRDEQSIDHYFEGIKPDYKPNILVVDDEQIIVSMVSSQIKSYEIYDIYGTTSLEKAIDLFKERRYFLILLDLKFENKTIDDVITFCKQVRDLDRYVFIVIYTGYFDHAFNNSLISYIDDIFQKPYTSEELRTKLFIWNLKYRRRIYYIKDLSLKVDCVKNAVSKMLEDQQDKGKSEEARKQMEEYYD